MFSIAEDSKDSQIKVVGKHLTLFITILNFGNMLKVFLFVFTALLLSAYNLVAQPSNNDCTDAISMNAWNGECNYYSLERASLDIYTVNCLDYDSIGMANIWFNFVAQGAGLFLKATPDSLNSIQLSLIKFDGANCDSSDMVVLTCSDSLSLEYDSLGTGDLYFIVLTFKEGSDTGIEICIDNPIDSPPENDNCIDAESLGVVQSSDEFEIKPPVCVAGSNLGSSADSIVFDCIPSGWGTVYYTFSTDAIAERISLSISSDEMQNFGVALFSSGCEDPDIVSCNSTNNGKINLTNLEVNPNSTYFILIGSAESNTGDVELCLRSFLLPEQCIVSGSEPTLEVTHASLGSSHEGPFQPGEEVTFLYTLPSYQATQTIQWLQAIIPVFGNGWNPSSFDEQGRPIISGTPNSAGGATWSWWDDGEISYNGASIFYTTFFNDAGRLSLCYWTDPDCPNTGLNGGDGLPAGWYAFLPGNPEHCQNDGNPNNGWGDGNTGPWQVEFTLIVRDSVGPEGCSETGFTDLSVKVFTMSDAQIGCWDGGSPNACAADIFSTPGALVNQCCSPPIINKVEDEICSGTQTNVELTSDQDPMVSFSWTVTAPPSVSGADGGSGTFINQTLVNTSNQPQLVYYNVTAFNETEWCLSTVESIPVLVYPEIMVDLGPDIDGCLEGEFQLGQNLNVSGGGPGPFSFQWSGGLGSDPNPIVSPDSSVTFVLTVIDQKGCSGTGAIQVDINPSIQIELSPEREFCVADSILEISVISTSGQSPFEFEWTTPFGNLLGPEIIATVAGTYLLEVTDANGCSGEKSIEITMFDIPPPVASFEFEVQSDGVFRFKNLSDFADNYFWNFGDGNTSNDFSPIHEYLEAGTYWVVLFVDNACGQDSFGQFVEFEPTTVLEFEELEFRFYPNPSSGVFNLEFSEAANHVRSRVYDIKGRLIFDKIWPENSTRLTIDILDYPSGIYWLELDLEGKQYRYPLQLINR